MIELYIDRHKADLTTDVSVPMNYELEKLQNPTIIKNNFSKTIQLQATPTNNKIFSFFYELDKVHTENSFCANKRVPFQLFRDADLVESGYLQLNNIKYTKNTYVYEITLYGGLGDFFYNLSYDAEGNELSLADLDFGLGENDSDFQFEMNADFVTQCWNNHWVEAGSQLDGGVLTFIPSYNGLYEDFSNDKALVNVWSSAVFPGIIVNEEDYSKGWQTIDGYGLATFNKELTEWQMRDLRCYKQRPALRFESFIKAICNPENNGGYEVELDEPNFFNRENPYYKKTWIALPLLNPDSEEYPKNKYDLGINISSSSLNVSLNSQDSPSATITYSDYTPSELINEYGGSSTISIDCDFSLWANTSYYNGNPKICISSDKWAKSGIGVWLEALVGGVTIGISNCILFTNGNVNSVSELKANYNNYPSTSFNIVKGVFEWGDSNYNYVFNSNEGANTFRLSIKNLQNFENVEYKLCVKRWFSVNPTGMSEWVTPYMFTPSGSYIIMNNCTLKNFDCTGEIGINAMTKSLQNYTITKNQLLKNKITPASLLTSYTKLFGLYFVKDATQKKIKICTRNTFFENADIIDIDDKIDYSSEYKIEPLLFNKKWYKLTCPSLETTKMKTYKGDYYEAEYGQKRINTNYNFNTDTEDLYKDNQYQNVITMLDSSKYYRNFTHKDYNNYVPPFVIDGCKYTLWQNGNKELSKEIEINPNEVLSNEKPPVQFGTLVGADAIPKICCFDLDNDKQSLNDLNVSLVFFNDLQDLKDSNGEPIYYTISNDLPLMSTLNDGEPMYLCTNTEIGGINNDEKICVRTNRLPQFTRYNIEFGNVVNSLDFGLPLETYIDANYTEDSTLYNSFWRNFYLDQFSENTRKLTTYVKFDDIQLGNHSLSNFYYFSNCYWLLNKIVDYDIANPYKKVKCEFIKVNDVSNYTNGQQTFVPFFEVDPEFDRLENWNVLTPGYVTYGGSWEVEFTAPYGIEHISTNGKYTLTQNGTDYKLTIYDITDDIGVYIAGKQPVDINVTYYFGNGVTPTTGHSHQSIQLAFNEKSASNIVYSNVVDEFDSMDIRQASPLYIYWRVNPNPYYDNEHRLQLGIRIYVTYEDGTRTNIFSGASSTDSWSGNTTPMTKVVTSIELQVYNFTDASFVPSTNTPPQSCYDDLECDFDEICNIDLDDDGIEDYLDSESY